MSTTIEMEAVREHYRKNLPLVLYCRPGERTVMGFLQQTPELFLVEDFSQSGFVFAPFDKLQKPVLFPEQKVQRVKIGEENVSEKDSSSKDLTTNPQEGREDYLKMIRKALSRLQEGHIQKVVLSRKLVVPVSNSDPLRLFTGLVAQYPAAFVYIWYHPQIGCWMGATPELLLRTSGTRFSTMALAGTQQYQGEEKVEWRKKEIQEQQFVTDEILEKLAPFSGNLNVSEVTTTRAGRLLHLKTDIRGELRKNPDGKAKGGLQQIIDALHPTPAICGLPTDRARDFILSEERYDREFYTGFLGTLNLREESRRKTNRINVEQQAYRTVTRKSELFVNLRCMKVEKEQVAIYIGGGITADSDPQAEWEETVNKSQTMLRTLIG